MVSKCANPDCSRTFLKLGAGRLFRIDRKGTCGYETEFFWLCPRCAESMTITFGYGEEPKVVSRLVEKERSEVMTA